MEMIDTQEGVNITLVPNYREYLEIVQNVRREHRFRGSQRMALNMKLIELVKEGKISELNSNIVREFFNQLEENSQ